MCYSFFLFYRSLYHFKNNQFIVDQTGDAYVNLYYFKKIKSSLVIKNYKFYIYIFVSRSIHYQILFIIIYFAFFHFVFHTYLHIYNFSKMHKHPQSYSHLIKLISSRGHYCFNNAVIYIYIYIYIYQPLPTPRPTSGLPEVFRETLKAEKIYNLQFAIRSIPDRYLLFDRRMT